MIVQITLTRNELFLIKEMMPLWQKYADGFVFMVDRSTDGTYEYLMENKEKFNNPLNEKIINKIQRARYPSSI